MRLKPAKCVIIISGCELTQSLIHAVRSWLKANVPDFQDFSITNAGKYLGWYLGRNSIALSFAAPLEKYTSRIQEVVDGSAPATVAIVRYNQRVIPVLSYVAQLAVPSRTIDLAAREHGAIHRILRMPPKSMSRELMHNIGFSTVVSPIPVVNYALAIMYRFALSEKQYLYSLASDVRSSLCDSSNVHLSQLGTRVPAGFLDSPPILLCLLEALEFQSGHSRILKAIECEPEVSWLDQRGKSDEFSKSDKVQTVVLKALAPAQDIHSIGVLIARKLCVTLGTDFASQCSVNELWFVELFSILGEAKVFLRMCWLKTISGAWTTTTRMHEQHTWKCIFGCFDRDDLLHYLVCPVLWGIAIGVLPGEGSISVGERLCLRNPSLLKLQRVALVHGVYHACKNDSSCLIDGSPRSAHFVQNRGHEFCRALEHLV